MLRAALMMMEAVALLAAAQQPATAAEDRHIRVSVVDHQGDHVKGAYLWGVAQTDGNFGMHVEADLADGRNEKVRLLSGSMGSYGELVSFDWVVVSDEGVARGVVEEEDLADLEEMTVTLRPVRPVKVTIESPMPLSEDAQLFATIADFGGHVYTKNFATGPFSDRQGETFTVAPVTAREGNVYTLLVPDLGAEPLHFSLDDPGSVRFCQFSPMLSSSELGDSLTLTLPEAGTLAATFTVPEDEDPQDLTIKLSRTAAFDDATGETRRYGADLLFLAEEDVRSLATGPMTLPSGSYEVEFATGTARNRWDRRRPDFFEDRQRVTVEPGKQVTAAATYRQVEAVDYEGDQAARVLITAATGEPVAGRDFELYVRDTPRGMLLVGSATTDEGGRATFEGLKPGTYWLQNENNGIGEVTIKGAGEEPQVASFNFPPNAGDPMIDAVLTDVDTGEEVRLSDFKGRVLFLDFWATWCGPCQGPMAHNSRVLERMGNDWAGKAEIIAISCDESKEKLVEHIAKEGWGNVRHLIATEGGMGWKAKVMQDYGIRWIPTALLVDQSGTIVWRGNPSGFRLEERIDELIAKGPSAGGG